MDDLDYQLLLKIDLTVEEVLETINAMPESALKSRLTSTVLDIGDLVVETMEELDRGQ